MEQSLELNPSLQAQIDEVIEGLYILGSCGFKFVIAHDFNEVDENDNLKVIASGNVTMADFVEAMLEHKGFKGADKAREWMDSFKENTLVVNE